MNPGQQVEKRGNPSCCRCSRWCNQKWTNPGPQVDELGSHGSCVLAVSVKCRWLMVIRNLGGNSG